ncbi:sensor histidine kinase [Galbitalea soli]|uniref:sensor histidine kinase n=1 Tax=Galbitalea soli TaxID=1268042 RepID=UPI0015CEE430|nr:ATP-binding protein [Galbitalea soli]NYJ30006.1 signal transduction histidine kinase [Galbitalea soli]
MSSSATGQRAPAQIKQPRNPISRKQVETVISRSVAASGFVFGAQTVGPLLGQINQANPIWVGAIVSALFASIIVSLIASIVQRFVRPGHALVAIVYVIALVSWPFAVSDPSAVTKDNHWLYYMLTVGTATAAIAFSTRVSTIYLFGVPIIYGIIRLTPQGGGATAPLAALDSIYAIILGAAIVIIVTMLRQAAVNVDTAQATALDRYSHAVRQHATEVERVQVDSIVHDSVLTTLLSAARAYTPEAKELAATMAGNAIGHLHDAALVQPDDGTTMRLRDIARRISEAAAAMSPPFEVRGRDAGPRSIPVQAGEAIYSAAVQSMVNSLQHGGTEPTIERWVTLRGIRPGGIEVAVGDTGAGFRVDAVPTERLGVRVSILERVSNAGGTAVITSAPGEGTLVTLRWPALTPAPVIGEDGELTAVDREARR